LGTRRTAGCSTRFGAVSARFFEDSGFLAGSLQGQVGAGRAASDGALATFAASAGTGAAAGTIALAAPPGLAITCGGLGRLRRRSSSFFAVGVRSLSGYCARNA